MIAVIHELVKTLDQGYYDEIFEVVDLTKVTCTCGVTGDFIMYGTYKRTVKNDSDTFQLITRRVKCQSCGCTHAILPAALVPYQQQTTDVQKKILLYPLGSDELEELMTKNLGITEFDVGRIRKRFKQHWEQRLKTMGMDLNFNLFDLIQSSFAWFNRQFLQIRRGNICKIFIPTCDEFKSGLT